MKIITYSLVVMFLMSCSDVDLPSKEEVKNRISDSLSTIEFQQYRDKIDSMKESFSVERYESLKSYLANSEKIFDTRIWRWFKQVEGVVSDGNIEEAYRLIEGFQASDNIKNFERDLLYYLNMALDNKSGKSDIPILNVILESDLAEKYGDEIGTVIVCVAVIAFNPHGGMF